MITASVMKGLKWMGTLLQNGSEMSPNFASSIKRIQTVVRSKKIFESIFDSRKLTTNLLLFLVKGI